VTQALSSLVGGSAVTGAGGAATSPALLTGGLTGIVPQVALAPSSASNDNASLMTSQTQSLVQAIASVGNSQIQALRDEMAALRAQNERLITAVSNPRARPARPAAKAA
jgi:hypothetical protein